MVSHITPGQILIGSLGRTAPPTQVPVNTALPVIFGTAQSGQTLTATHGAWSYAPSSYTYQWKADGVSIGGATVSTFLLTDTQVGAVITVGVVAHNVIGDSSPATSAATAAVIAIIPVNTAVPVITGSTVSGQVLTASSGTWTHTPTGYAYQWQAGGSPIGGATMSTFTLTDTQLGLTITVTVAATNSGGTSAPVASAAVGPVTGGGGGSASLDFTQASNSMYIPVVAF